MSTGRRSRTVRTRLRWAAAGATLAATATAAVITAPASSAATVGAQLALTGVAYSKSPTGGNTVGVHPGDTVSFSASAIPTAGAGPLSGLLAGLAGTLLGFEVDIPARQLPGVSSAVKLVAGPHCSGGVPSVSVRYPNKGTFSFTYTVRRFVAPATPLTPCATSQIKFSGSQLSQLTQNHVAVNATTTYTVHVVVATNPPSGGIPIQVPSVVVGGHGGPVNLPTVKVGVPQGGGQLPGSVNGGAPVAGGGGAQNGRGGAAGDVPQYQGVPETVPEMVVPHGGDGGGSGDGTGGGTGGGTSNGGGGGGAAALAPGADGTANLAPTTNGERVATAASDAPSSSAPMGLLLAAGAALIVVAAGYTRLALARRRA